MKNVITFSPLNCGLVIAGLVLISIGLFRTSPLKFDRALCCQLGPLLLFLIVEIWAILHSRPASSPFSAWAQPVGKDWAKFALVFGSKFLPIIVTLIAVMSLGVMVVKIYDQNIISFMKEHRIFGFVFGSAIVPTPNSVSSIVEDLWKDAGMRASCLIFLQASALMSFPLFMMRLTGYTNNELTVKMYIEGCVISIGLFFLATPLFKVTEWIFKLGVVLKYLVFGFH